MSIPNTDVCVCTENTPLLPCPVALKENPYVVLFYFLTRPWCLAQECEARIYTRVYREAFNTYFLSKLLPPKLFDQFFDDSLE